MTAVAESIATMTPAQIDEQLADLSHREAQARGRLRSANEMLHGVDFRGRPRLRNPADIARYEAQVEAIEAEISSLNEQQVPFEIEFEQRGGWNRCFLVTNSNGHVHSSTGCTTCYPRTQYAWLYEWSGKSYEEIINDAAERACTVCYPDAPVEKKSVMYSPEERKDQAQREQERQAREAKRAVQAAKAITAPDGSPLRGRWGVIKTERTAQIEAVDALLDARVWSEFHPDRYYANGSEMLGEWLDRCKDNATRYAAEAVPLIEALAAKRGQTISQARAELQKKADAKFKKEYR